METAAARRQKQDERAQLQKLALVADVIRVDEDGEVHPDPPGPSIFE